MCGLFHNILYCVCYILYNNKWNYGRFATIPMGIIIKTIHHQGWPGILSTVK